MANRFTGTALDFAAQYGTTKFSLQPVEKSVTFTGAANKGAVGTVDLFQVTGTVLIKLFAVSTVDLVGSSATIAVGTANSTGGICAQQTATGLSAGKILNSTAVAAEVIVTSANFNEFIVSNGQKIIATVATANITAGNLKFLCSWIPLSSGASVVAL